MVPTEQEGDGASSDAPHVLARSFNNLDKVSCFAAARVFGIWSGVAAWLAHFAAKKLNEAFGVVRFHAGSSVTGRNLLGLPDHPTHSWSRARVDATYSRHRSR